MQLDQSLGRIQKELDLCFNRIDRLSLEDNYGNNISRPHPTAKEEE